MRIVKKIVMLAILPVLLNSCIGTSKTTGLPVSTLNKDIQTHLLMNMDDFELIAQVEDSIKFSVYLGVFNTNRDYRDTRRVAVSSGVLNGVSLNRRQYANRLLYKMYEQYPEADLIIPTVVTEERLRLFLGSRRVVKVKARVLKLK